MTKKNGDVIEGYLYQNSSQGIVIASMGNLQTFVSRDDIRYEGAIDGKSFMPGSFAALPKQAMVDLISYIRTLQ